MMKSTMGMLTLLVCLRATCFVGMCQTCSVSNSVYCQTCMSGYQMVSGSCCIDGQDNCQQCFIDTNYCDSCKSQRYALSSGTCKECNTYIADCVRCDSTTKCIDCGSNHAIVNSTCQSCSSLMTNCQKCNSQTNCVECIAQYALNATGHCFQCETAYPNCTSCDEENCTLCDMGFVLNNQTQCQICSQTLEQCLYCSSETVCTQCLTFSHAVNPNTFQCNLCNVFMWSCTQCYHYTHCFTCVQDPSIVINPTIGRCQRCPQALGFCEECHSTTHCTRCNDYAVLNLSDYTCVPCWQHMYGCQTCSNETQCNRCYLGYLVSSGCAVVIGCLEIFLDPSISLCARCDTVQFHQTPVNGSCVCLQGHLAQSVCTTVFGCIVAELVNTTGRCIECNASNHFQAVQGECQCKQYYYRVDNECFEICGDGYLVGQGCDDGNLVNGDGCSSNCNVEENYICTESNRRSSCAYNNRVVLSLDSIYKQGSANSILITFALTPYISIFSNSNFDGSVFFSTDAIYNWTYFASDSSLKLTVDYFTDIGGQQANFTLVYDHDFIRNPPVTILFEIRETNGASLDYQQSQWAYADSVSILTKILAIGALLLLVSGSWAQKMIGVEALYAFQITRLVQIHSLDYSPNMEYFQGLNLTVGVFQIFASGTSLPLQWKYYSRLSLSTQFIYSCQLPLFLQVLMMSIFGISVLVNYVKEPPSRGREQNILAKNNKNLSTNQELHVKIRSCSFDALVFPVIAGFIPIILICLTLNGRIEASSSFLNTFQCISMIFSSLLIILTVSPPVASLITGYSTIYSQETQNTAYHKHYILYFLTYSLLLGLFLNIAFMQLFPYSDLLLASLVLVYTLSIIVYRPYTSRVHNVGLIVNQLSIIFTFTWVVLDHLQMIDLLVGRQMVFVQVAFLSLVLGYGVVRVIYESVTQKRKSIEQYNAMKKSKKSKKAKKIEDVAFSRELNQQFIHFNKEYTQHFHNIGPSLAVESHVRGRETKEQQTVQVKRSKKSSWNNSAEYTALMFSKQQRRNKQREDSLLS